MSDPERLSKEEQAKATLQAETEEINRLERLLSQHGQSAPSIGQIQAPVAADEKLFSRRTLFGWGFAALLVVFVIRMILPEVFATVKETIGSKMREPSGNTAVTPVVAPTTTAAPTVIKIVKKR